MLNVVKKKKKAGHLDYNVRHETTENYEVASV